MYLNKLKRAAAIVLAGTMTMTMAGCGKKEESYTIPNSVMNIGDYSFWECSNLRSIIIPLVFTTVRGKITSSSSIGQML